MNTDINTASNTQSLLSSKAVLIRLFTSAFTGNPRDVALTSEVESSHGTEARRISVRKKIMQGKELNSVAATLQAVRKTAEKLSAPWLDGGLRIMSAKTLIEGKIEIEAGIREFNAAVDYFISSYDKIIENDRIALNGTFKQSDYLSPETLRTKFKARLEIFPIASDFRVEGIDEAVKSELQAEMERLTAARVCDAKTELVERIRERVLQLSSRLSAMTDESRFHTSTVTNIIDACKEVPAANFDGDVKLDHLADTIETLVAPISPDDIRGDGKSAKEEAQQIAVKALAEIQEAMAGFVC